MYNFPSAIKSESQQLLDLKKKKVSENDSYKHRRTIVEIKKIQHRMIARAQSNPQRLLCPALSQL
jgi:hypothetical protein